MLDPWYTLVELLHNLIERKASEEPVDLGPSRDARRNSKAQLLLLEGRVLLLERKVDKADTKFAAALKKDPYVVWSLSRGDQESLVWELAADADRLNVAKLISQLQEIQKSADLTQQKQS